MLTSREDDGDAGNSSSSSSASSSRDLLISCAELVHRRDIQSARRAASLLSMTSSELGDSTDRVVHHFTLALSRRLSLVPSPPPPNSDTEISIQSSYLSLNQITPFLRFAHLTANQAILESVNGCKHLHILDFDTSHGLQWPPLLQSIADISVNPPSVRITGTGTDISVLLRTADRLTAFANTLGLSFEFHPLVLPSSTDFSFHLRPGETLAVNCVHFLNKIIKEFSPFDTDGSRDVRAFLRAVRLMNPSVVTVAEREAGFNTPIFLQRFMECLEYYTAVFEALEATLPPGSRERESVERVWLGKEIGEVVASTSERCERFEKWGGLMKECGFRVRELSPFAVSQARLLLRLHYPSEGWQLRLGKEAAFLGWQNKPLFSVSSWQ